MAYGDNFSEAKAATHLASVMCTSARQRKIHMTFTAVTYSWTLHNLTIVPSRWTRRNVSSMRQHLTACKISWRTKGSMFMLFPMITSLIEIRVELTTILMAMWCWNLDRLEARPAIDGVGAQVQGAHLQLSCCQILNWQLSSRIHGMVPCFPWPWYQMGLQSLAQTVCCYVFAQDDAYHVSRVPFTSFF